MLSRQLFIKHHEFNYNSGKPHPYHILLRVTFLGVVHERVSRERHGRIKASVSRQRRSAGGGEFVWR